MYVHNIYPTDNPSITSIHRQAVQWMRRAFPADHPYVSGMETNLATLKQEQEEKMKGTYDPSKYRAVTIHRAMRG